MARQLSLISNKSFAGLAGAHFLEAANDNLFKTVVSLFAVGVLADAKGGAYLSLTGILICGALPAVFRLRRSIGRHSVEALRDDGVQIGRNRHHAGRSRRAGA